MAAGCRRVAGTDVGVGITGIAGPDGGTPEKPVGLTYVAVDGAAGTRVRRAQFPGDRERVRVQATQMALEMLRRGLLGLAPLSVKDEERLRTFVALEIAEDMRARIASLQDELRDRAPELRWTRPEGIHLTLRFLGSTTLTQIERLKPMLSEAAGGVPAGRGGRGGPGDVPAARRASRAVARPVDAGGVPDAPGRLRARGGRGGLPSRGAPVSRAPDARALARSGATSRPSLPRPRLEPRGHSRALPEPAEVGGSVYSPLATFTLGDRVLEVKACP